VIHDIAAVRERAQDSRFGTHLMIPSLISLVKSLLTTRNMGFCLSLLTTLLWTLFFKSTAWD
jgi:hypothetical protein